LTIFILFPLVIIFAAALLAVVYGLIVNRREENYKSDIQRPQSEILNITQLSWLLALAPLAAFILLATRVPAANAGIVDTWQWEWLPSLGLTLGFYIDDLALFFGLLVTFIGVLVVIYTGYYFKGDNSAWRFLAYLLLFMGCMLGLVLAGDVLTLFIFWEGTSIVSYLLVAYKTGSEEARYGAFRALFITGGGGIALLAGLLFVSTIAGSTDYATILTSGDLLRSSEFYNVILALVAFGAFTKSAQWPAHIWLPGAMSAPTPASAYLHSATMVKAGIYLMARMNPALGFTETWFWVLTIIGGITMIAGAYLGLKQNDLKALLAYSTISQLGVLMMLIGQDIPEAYKALMIGILAHALYKSALFMVAGIIDHETGTRDLRRLGGLSKVMPFTFGVALLAGLSMAGLPPLFGFLAKETLLAYTTAVHPTLPVFAATLIRWSAVVAGALMLAQAGLLVYETFLGKPKDPDVHGHEAPIPMWLAPAIPAALSIILSILPGPKEEATLLSGAAQDAFGEPVKVSFVLFHGLTVELLLSIVAITLGTLLFVFRGPIRAWQQQLLPELSFNALYRWVLKTIDRAAFWATRLQQGKLRPYLAIMLLAVSILVIGLSIAQSRPGARVLSWPNLDFQGGLLILRVMAPLIVVGASAATIMLKRDFSAILAIGASGLGMALIFVLEPAPDVALVQIVVDILSMVILVLALTRLPRKQRHKAQFLSEQLSVGKEQLPTDSELYSVISDQLPVTSEQSIQPTSEIQHPKSNIPSWFWQALLAGLLGIIVAGVTLVDLLERPRESIVSPYYVENAKTATGATDIVGAVVVDFRALDTLIEITVFSFAGLGIATLLAWAARTHDDHNPPEKPPDRKPFTTLGIGGQPLSSFIRTTAFVALPLSIMLAFTQIMYGHDQPGDGFTAGVIISLAIALWYVAFGYEEARRRLPWLHSTLFIATGILLAIFTGLVAMALTGSFLGNIDFTEGWAFLPKGFHISTSFLIELAICLAVLGGATHMLSTLGHPETTEEQKTEN
jgi:NADH:ubiquinone oxidoreductase subunit 5 (subunit L)/multisubunit Na+/H+ antiporter MnhA subunit/multisubunit Na+/H+ antiporter MnhB subunit